MINYNSPDHQKERANVVPLSIFEMKLLVSLLNDYIPKESLGAIEAAQSLIWDYENLCHMRETLPVWVSVNDRLPESHVDVIVILKDGTMAVDAVCSKSNKYWLNLGDINNVTHWQRLPQPTTK